MKFVLLKVVLPLAVIFVGFGYMSYMVASKPTPPKVERPKPTTLVETVVASPGDRRVTVEAVGRVKPAREMVLAPEVSGRIVEVHEGLVTGGVLPAGAVAVRIDPEDYELAVSQLRAQVVRARFELQLEAGRRTVAAKEWRQLEGDIETTKAGERLALREPHAALAKANLGAARSALAQAQLRVSKTEVRVPFNAFVRREGVEVGQLAGPQSQLAQLVGTDAFWVEAAVPLDRLRWIDIPGVAGFTGTRGSKVRVIQSAGDEVFVEREGYVLRLLDELDPLGVQARVLVEVPDPLGLSAAVARDEMPLLLNAFVRLEIEGRQLHDVVAVPRVALREGDRVWVMTPQGRLAIRPVEVVWRDRDIVLVSAEAGADGVRPGERIITSRLTAASEGMALRAAGDVISQATEPSVERAAGPATGADGSPTTAPAEAR